METKDSINPEVILLGDSITHLWGGQPTWEGHPPNGAKSFAKTFADKRVLNLGYGYDRIQNVLWRLDHGEVRHLQPEHVIVNIGTNNLWPTKNTRGNTADEIAEGIRAVVFRRRAKLPEASIILMGLFPRGQKPDDSSRAKSAKVNRLFAAFSNHANITFLDLTQEFLQPDGTIAKELMDDFLHPTERGYGIWGHALRELDSKSRKHSP